MGRGQWRRFDVTRQMIYGDDDPEIRSRSTGREVGYTEIDSDTVGGVSSGQGNGCIAERRSAKDGSHGFSIAEHEGMRCRSEAVHTAPIVP